MPVSSTRKKLPFALWFVQHRAKNAPRKFLLEAVFKLRRTTLQKSSCLEPWCACKSCAGLQKRRAAAAFPAEGIFEPSRRPARETPRRPPAVPRSGPDLSYGGHAVLRLRLECADELSRIATVPRRPKITRLNSYIFAQAINNVPASYAVVRHFPARNKPGRIRPERGRRSSRID
jgi:hypothetical protein